MTHMSDLSYTERLQVEQIAKEIESTGVGTVDLSVYRGGKGIRSRLREPLQRLLGYPIEYGVQIDDDGSRFGWYSRREETITPEQQAARERLGFGQ